MLSFSDLISFSSFNIESAPEMKKSLTPQGHSLTSLTQFLDCSGFVDSEVFDMQAFWTFIEVPNPQTPMPYFKF